METQDKKNRDNSGQTVIYLNELCRLCLAKKKTMVPIYDGSNEDVPIPVKLMACVSLEVYKGDGLPDHLCQQCKENLDQSYQFKKKCHNAHNKLKKHKDLISELHEFDDGEPEDTAVNDKSQSVKRTVSESVIYEEDELSVDGQFQAKTPKLEKMYSSDITGMESDEIMGKESPDFQSLNDEYNSNDGSVWSTNNLPNENECGYTLEVSDDNTAGTSIKLMPVEDNNISENGELKVFKCDQCPKAFTRRIMLKSHQTVHSTQRGFTCSACDKWFPTNSALLRHERTHTGEKPFRCNICERAFSQKEILLRHLMTHSGQKPFKCQDCDKSFTQREALKVHMRRHQKLDPNDIQLHHCQLCPKAFCHASGLSRHLVTHTGRTYKCVECEKSFTDKSSLLRHSRIHAGMM